MGIAVKLERNDAERMELRRSVERMLGEQDGLSSVTALDCQASPFACRAPAEVLCATLECGRQVKLFLKSPGMEEADHPEKQVRDREIRIYRELLSDPGIPSPRFYGAQWNATTQRREIFLEYIPDWDLRYQELAYWFSAAAEVGRLHAHFARQTQRLQVCDYLLRFNTPYLAQWAHWALEVTQEEYPRLADDLRTVVDQYQRSAQLLADQPLTLVHNDLGAKNILVDRSVQPARICIVDWEMAGIGCGLLDLVTLKYGLDAASDRQMCEAYFTAVAGTPLALSNEAEIERVLAACELHKAMLRLWRNRVWRLPVERVTQWVTEACQWIKRI